MALEDDFQVRTGGVSGFFRGPLVSCLVPDSCSSSCAPAPQTCSRAGSNACTTAEITTRGDNTLPQTRTHTPNMFSHRVQRTHHHRDHNQGRQHPPLHPHPHPKHVLAPGPTHAPPPRSQPGETTPSPTPAPTPQTQSRARSNASTNADPADYRTQVSASPFCPITGAGAGMQRRLDAQRAQEGQSVRA